MSYRISIKKRIFNKKYRKYINCQIPLQIYYGGSSSGKSVFSAQRTVIDLLTTERNFLVVRKVSGTIRDSYFTEIKKALKKFKAEHLCNIRETDFKITGPKGNNIYFRGLDNVEKIKSIAVEVGSITDLIIEEATEISENDFNQLQLRMRGKSEYIKRTTLLFNPIYRTHWICKRFFNSQNIKFYQDDKKLILHSTYLDNEHLANDDIERINSMKEASPYHYMVYALGEWGVLGDLIFTKYRIEKLTEEYTDSLRCGLDFGFTNDPAAIVRTAMSKPKKEIYIYKELYQRGLTNQDIAREGSQITQRLYVWCDCAEPKSIAELQQLGMRAKGASKTLGGDSLLYSIQWLQNYTIVIDESCINTVNEISTYQWKKDKDGNSLNQPVDVNNHTIDALRYAYSNDRVSVSAGNSKAI